MSTSSAPFQYRGISAERYETTGVALVPKVTPPFILDQHDFGQISANVIVDVLGVSAAADGFASADGASH
jgi:hypothetical protein